ncbi:MAG: HDOD domain-containing protein [Pirellulales bacterium]|nr:HDOD domain-containing protein [Pirellulales bacterium]
MTTPAFLALVVDDEPISRKMLTFALTQEGFACDGAEDGEEALLLCRHHPYDLVVTDLIMPNKHGHSLVVELLAGEAHPVVIVHTSVDDPRITKDLLARGVDDVAYKPTNYKTLAARAAVLVGRRRDHRETASARNAPREAAIETVDITDIEARMANLSKILPVSQAAFDVYDLASSDDVQVSQIAAGIARDPSLSADVLRLANSAFCRNNPSGKRIVELEEAVLRVGQKRIGELALATSALSAVTANVLPWIDMDLAWRRSVAAGVAVDLLLSRGDYPGVGGGLFLSAIMHLLGRLGLGMSYPRQYQRMIERCKQSGETLDALEESVFPLNTGQVMGCLLKAWNIPEEICLPLNYTANSFLSLAPLDEPLRTQAELLKLAIFIGQIAVGKWDAWDKLEFPSNSVVKRLRIESLARIVRDARADTQQIIGHQRKTAASEGKQALPRKPESAAAQSVGQLDYCKLSSASFDFLREIVASMGIELNERAPHEVEANRNLLIDCLWSPPKKFTESFPADKPCGAKLIVAAANHAVFYRHLGKVVPLPTSYGTLQAACGDMARRAESSHADKTPTLSN